MTANAAGPGAFVLTCDGDNGQWVATINTAQPTDDAQVANKKYVDDLFAGSVLPACTNDNAGLCALETSRSSNDPDFTAENIKTGVNILGVTGTFSGGAGGLTGPTDCPAIGDKCTDTTIFAGWHPTTHARLFIPSATQERPGNPGEFLMQWKTSVGIDDIRPVDSSYDGLINHANGHGVLNDFPAFSVCENLNFGGHSDWYLPSQIELYYLWSVYKAIEAKGNTSFIEDTHWSSSEYTPWTAFLVTFDTGYSGPQNKDSYFAVRCMRR